MDICETLSELTPEELQKLWDETSEWDDVDSPTFDDFISLHEKLMNE